MPSFLIFVEKSAIKNCLKKWILKHCQRFVGKSGTKCQNTINVDLCKWQNSMKSDLMKRWWNTKTGVEQCPFFYKCTYWAYFPYLTLLSTHLCTYFSCFVNFYQFYSSLPKFTCFSPQFYQFQPKFFSNFSQTNV